VYLPFLGGQAMTIFLPTVPASALGTKILRARFGQNQTSCTISGNTIDLSLKIPVLGQENTEYILSQPGRIYQQLGFQLIETEDRLAGVLVQQVDFPLEQSAYDIYLNFLELTKNWKLFRVWNYVPYINEEALGLENYRSFCKGRSLAFEDFFGKEFNFKMPAASAVGINDNKLVVYFIAGKESATNIENPEQVPAFYYPQQYGPRSPSFARGTVVVQDGKHIGYLSGTASIKSHKSVTLRNISEQFHTTLDNMSLVFERMGLLHERLSYHGNMPDPAKYDRTFKVYIRHLEDADYIKGLFSQSIFESEGDHILYLRADICRAELDLEIEAIITER
jgi:chorismate lyase/3-hydroxybenzoate synthase